MFLARTAQGGTSYPVLCVCDLSLQSPDYHPEFDENPLGAAASMESGGGWTPGKSWDMLLWASAVGMLITGCWTAGDKIVAQLSNLFS